MHSSENIVGSYLLFNYRNGIPKLVDEEAYELYDLLRTQTEIDKNLPMSSLITTHDIFVRDEIEPRNPPYCQSCEGSIDRINEFSWSQMVLQNHLDDSSFLTHLPVYDPDIALDPTQTSNLPPTILPIIYKRAWRKGGYCRPNGIVLINNKWFIVSPPVIAMWTDDEGAEHCIFDRYRFSHTRRENPNEIDDESGICLIARAAEFDPTIDQELREHLNKLLQIRGAF